MTYKTRNLPYNSQHRGGFRTGRRINIGAANFTPRGNVRGGRLDGPTPPPAPLPFSPRKVTLTLTTLQTDVRYNITGNVLWATASSASSAAITVRFVKGGQISDAVDVAPGFRLFGVPFDYVLISNAAQAGVTLTLTYGDDPKAGAVEGDTV
ncbi:MAG TPA: hypothetical protein VEK85_17195 [Gemmatimonadales bacterium]|nr:hypothetical protein [Gemmatimonadales bacterium]